MPSKLRSVAFHLGRGLLWAAPTRRTFLYNYLEEILTIHSYQRVLYSTRDRKRTVLQYCIKLYKYGYIHRKFSTVSVEGVCTV